MNESIVKITSGDWVNFTFENDEYYTINLSESNYYLMTSLENSFDTGEFTTKTQNFGDIELHARYVGKSRIDGLPLFAVDVQSAVRKAKIDQIIN